ncbi:Clp protease N-terminal domain-containing protein [Nocardia brasiliensis]|uniref:Clp protease N-terminal domain-containing protein n=1 Tax=Nocardia brasiliensis TaxID=37326 RepID=UPI003672CE1D
MSVSAAERNGNAPTVPGVTGDGVHVDSWISPRLEHALQRAVDIANELGCRQVHLEHVALAILEDPESPTSRNAGAALTGQQLRQAFLDALPVHESTDQGCGHRSGADIFCGCTSH